MNQEKQATEIMQSYYEIITNDLIGAFPLQIAKELKSPEFMRAKKCALVSVNNILEPSIGIIKSQKFWLSVKREIENY